MNKDKENILKLIKWGIILIIAILLTTCGTGLVKDLIKANKPTSDTTVVHKVDTIFAHDTIYKFKGIKVPVPYIIHDTVVKVDGKDTCVNIKVYQDSLVDDNINIYYKDYIAQGTLLGKDLSYKLKVPLRIIDSQTMTIKVPTLYPPVFQIHASVIVGVNIFAPEIGVSYKRHTVTGGYNLTNKRPILGYKFTIFRK